MMYRKRKWFFVFAPVLFVGVVFLLGWAVMFLWNTILVPVAGVGIIGFWQALGLFALSKILFGSFGGRSGRKRNGNQHWKQKWANMNEEERQKFKEEWRKRCGSYSPKKNEEGDMPSS
jgi:hypothetical protein